MGVSSGTDSFAVNEDNETYIQIADTCFEGDDGVYRHDGRGVEEGRIVCLFKMLSKARSTVRQVLFGLGEQVTSCTSGVFGSPY
jgi:hypothetical protein